MALAMAYSYARLHDRGAHEGALLTTTGPGDPWGNSRCALTLHYGALRPVGKWTPDRFYGFPFGVRLEVAHLHDRGHRQKCEDLLWDLALEVEG